MDSVPFVGFPGLRCGRRLWIAAVCLGVFAALSSGGRQAAGLQAADEAPVAASAKHIATFVTLDGAITDRVTSSVRRAALDLQTQALQEQKQAFLVLELTPGISEFHHVYSLIDFLTSDATANLTTICWVPSTVTGSNVCIALACSEIVMHPDARLGDIGRGEALPQNDQLIVKSIINKRRNRRVTESLAVGLMDPASSVLQISVEPAAGILEKRVVTGVEAQQLRDAQVAIRDTRTLKEAGSVWMIGTAQARDWGVLVSLSASSRRELVDAYALPLDSLRERPTIDGQVKVDLIEIKGVIEPVLKSFLNRQIERAVDEGAKIIIFEVDSPGGYLYESEQLAEVIAGLKDRGVHAVAYIPDGAYSGAAIISLGCDDIYLKPDAKIGDAGAIRETAEGGQFERAPEKVLSPLKQLLGELARRKNRSPALAQAMCDIDLEVFQATHKTKGTIAYMSEAEIHESGDEWIKGPLVEESKKGWLLTVTGKRASELQLAQPPVASLDDLKSRLGIPAEQRLVAMQRTWVDDLVFLLNLPVVMGLLFFVGLVAIYLELHTMTGIFGLVSALCFGLFFWSKVLGGTAGTLEILLFFIGVVCLLLEFFVLPGFGFFGVTGILLTLVSIIMASQTFGHLGPNMSDSEQTFQTLKVFGTAVVGMVITAFALARFLPQIPLFNDMILAPPGADSAAAPRLKPELVVGTADLVGKSGIALTLLRPSGKAEIDGQLIDVISEGGFIPEGSPVQVVECSGKRVVVRKVENA
ncbi:MAG: NfeD family protein [Planctomycetaceae bacterium]